ncbi:hypothetical protein BGW80DRAFT_1128235, partial [Lactifluus volemus]
LGFWSPSTLQGCVHQRSSFPSSLPWGSIFWLEALCVASAIQFAARSPHPPACLAVFTDSLDTVQIFDSLRTVSTYNPILRFSCDLLIHSSISLRVFHVAATENIVADALSRSLFAIAAREQPLLKLYTFMPP